MSDAGWEYFGGKPEAGSRIGEEKWARYVNECRYLTTWPTNGAIKRLDFEIGMHYTTVRVRTTDEPLRIRSKVVEALAVLSRRPKCSSDFRRPPLCHWLLTVPNHGVGHLCFTHPEANWVGDKFFLAVI